MRAYPSAERVTLAAAGSAFMAHPVLGPFTLVTMTIICGLQLIWAVALIRSLSKSGRKAGWLLLSAPIALFWPWLAWLYIFAVCWHQACF